MDPFTLDIDGVSFEFIKIVGGEFSMGSLSGLPLETPVHNVSIEYDYCLGTTPVTQEQWQAIAPDKEFAFSGSPKLPADNVSWDEAIEFCHAISSKLEHEVRMPSEAEWEYACRSGRQSEFHFGEDELLASNFGWFEENSQGKTQPVGQKNPNPWGLHDMTGNVWEWCQDVWHSDYLGAPVDGTGWNEGHDQPRRCLRGGAYDMDVFRLRSAYRSYEWKSFRTDRFGLRLALMIEGQ